MGILYIGDWNLSNMAPMTTREATTVIPKWSAENIATFFKQVEAAWDYCQSESFEEEKFCKILKLQLNLDAAKVMENMGTKNQKRLRK